MCLMAFHLACVIRPGGLTTEVRGSEDRQVLKLAGESYFNIVFLSPYNSPVNRALVCLLQALQPAQAVQLVGVIAHKD